MGYLSNLFKKKKTKQLSIDSNDHKGSDYQDDPEVAAYYIMTKENYISLIEKHCNKLRDQFPSSKKELSVINSQILDSLSGIAAETGHALFNYIEVYYNRRRKHSTNGYKSPANYELECWNNKKAA